MPQRKTSIEKGIPYVPRYSKGPRPHTYGRRKHIWLVGPDERRHDQYYSWLKHRAQAKFRNEPHELSWAQWEEIWNNNNFWESRGRSPESVCLVRLDYAQPWQLDNVAIVSRRDQLARQLADKKAKGIKYKTRSDKGSKRS